MAMFDIADIGIIAAFIAGIVSFLSPCVLPLVPGYVSFIAGHTLEEVKQQRKFYQKVQILNASFLFVAGFSIVFISLGAGASSIGSFLRQYMYEANYLAGGVIIVFGLFMTGLIRTSWLNQEFRFNLDMPGGKLVSAFVLGMAFAFGWTPCIGPILGAILTLSATTANVETGIILLSVYSLGLAIPFLLVALFTKTFLENSKLLKKHGRLLQIFSGGILMLVGVGMITGYLSYAGTWLLNEVPFFQKLVF
jgi:cytochrome c-type biogenesis protein